MCPEKAKIFIADDDEDRRTMYERLLKLGDHEVLLKAGTLEEALSIIALLPQEIQVAFLDGNMRKGNISGSDGEKMVEAVHNFAPWCKTIGISASGKIEGADKNFDIQRGSIQELLQIIADL